MVAAGGTMNQKSGPEPTAEAVPIQRFREGSYRLRGVEELAARVRPRDSRRYRWVWRVQFRCGLPFPGPPECDRRRRCRTGPRQAGRTGQSMPLCDRLFLVRRLDRGRLRSRPFSLPPTPRAMPGWPLPRSKPANMLHRPCPPCGDHWRMRMRFSPLPRLPIAAT